MNDPINLVDPDGPKTRIIITRDYGVGTHAAVHVENGGSPVLYDPAGSYHDKTRGTLGQLSDDLASIDKYIKYQESLDSAVETYEFDITAEQKRKL